MATRGKVGCGGREIMSALWGSRGRPETNQWAELCAERQIAHKGAMESLRVMKTYVPDDAGRLVEAPRTSNKWSEARKAHRVPSED